MKEIKNQDIKKKDWQKPKIHSELLIDKTLGLSTCGMDTDASLKNSGC